jgi:hypothetical protein
LLARDGLSADLVKFQLQWTLGLFGQWERGGVRGELKVKSEVRNDRESKNR